MRDRKNPSSLASGSNRFFRVCTRQNEVTFPYQSEPGKSVTQACNHGDKSGAVALGRALVDGDSIGGNVSPLNGAAFREAQSCEGVKSDDQPGVSAGVFVALP